jgi:hypothetical protein
MTKSSEPIPKDSLFIKDLIRQVQKELVESQREREAAAEDPIFRVDGLTIEANFVVSRTGGAKGGLDFKIITLGGSRDIERQQVHKLTLTLTAEAAEGDREIIFQPIVD